MSESERRTAYLVIRLEGKPDRAVVWDTVDITVGRQPDQDIVVDDPEVSRRHAVFRREGERFTVEDLGTPLGTTVNEAPVTSHALRHGDVIRMGKLELRFGQTTRDVRTGEDVSFASHLKTGGPSAVEASEGGRTMLGFDPGDSLLFAPTAQPGLDPGPRAVSADGSLEELESLDPLGLSIDASQPGANPAARNLDRELEEKPDDWAVATAGTAPLAPVGVAPSATGGASRAGDPGLGLEGDVTAQLRLSISGPVAAVAALLSIVRDRPIQFGSLRLLIRDREG